MSGNTYGPKQLRVTFVLTGSNQFSNGSNTLTLTGLRMTATMQTYRFPAFPECDLMIYGILQADMNTLTDFELRFMAVSRNTVILEASVGDGWATVFAGQIASAVPIYQQAPDVPLRILGRVVYLESLASATPTSFTGTTDAVTAISGLAARIGASFLNEGVGFIPLANAYYPGTLIDQLSAVIQAANVDVWYDWGEVGNTGINPPVEVIITPKGGSRSLVPVFLTPQNGLIDYPTFDSQGWILAQSYYNPALKFGAQVTISGSDLPRANQTWVINQGTHTLDALKPDGAWFTYMRLAPVALFPYATSS